MSDTPARIPTMEELRATIHAIPGMRVQERGDETVSAADPSVQFYLTPYNAIRPQKRSPIFTRKNDLVKRAFAELTGLAEQVEKALRDGDKGWPRTPKDFLSALFVGLVSFPAWYRRDTIGQRISYEKERIQLAPELGGRRYTAKYEKKRPLVRTTHVFLLPDDEITELAMLRTPAVTDKSAEFVMMATEYRAILEHPYDSEKTASRGPR